MKEYVQQALDIVKAQASVRNMTKEEIRSMVQSLPQPPAQNPFLPLLWIHLLSLPELLARPGLLL